MENQSLELTQISQNYLLETSKWAKFLSIISFISLGFIGIIGLILTIISSQMTSQIQMMVIGVLYLIISFLYLFPAIYLFRFAVRIKAALNHSETATLEEGLENLKSLFKFAGILTIVVLSFYVVAIIIGMIAGLMFRFP